MRRVMLLLFSMVFLFSSCDVYNANKLDEKEVKTLLEELLPVGLDVTYVFFMEDSLECNKDPRTKLNNDYYLVVSDKFKSISDIKAYTESVFKKEFAQEYFYRDAFDDEPPKFIEKDNKLYADLYIWGIGNDLKEYNLDKLEIISQTDDEIVVATEYIYGYYDDDGIPFDEKEMFNICLKKENDKWLLNSKVF